MLTIHVRAEQRRLRIACQGALEATTLDRFVAAAAGAIAAGHREVVADLSDLLHLDSSGVSALAHLFRRLAEQGRPLRIEGLRGQPLALLRSARLDRVLVAGARPAGADRPARALGALARGA